MTCTGVMLGYCATGSRYIDTSAGEADDDRDDCREDRPLDEEAGEHCVAARHCFIVTSTRRAWSSLPLPVTSAGGASTMRFGSTPERHQLVAHALRALLRELDVGRRVAGLVGVAGDDRLGCRCRCTRPPRHGWCAGRRRRAWTVPGRIGHARRKAWRRGRRVRGALGLGDGGGGRSVGRCFHGRAGREAHAAVDHHLVAVGEAFAK